MLYKRICQKISRIMAVMLLLSMALITAPAQAAAFTPRYTAPERSNGYYYANNPFYQAGYGMPNCTAYAYGRAWEILGYQPNLSRGNAGQWWNYNKNGGYYAYGSTPKLGAIAVWDKWDSNQGHVAVVEAINGDRVTISESHWGGVNFDTRTCNANMSDYLTGMRFLGYIYIGDFHTYTNPPSNPQAWMSAYIFAVGEYPTFYASATDADHYVLGIDREGVRIDTPDLGSNTTYRRSFDQAGNYYYYASCANDLGSVDSEGVNFRVYDSKPRNPVISTSKPMYTTQEEVTINLGSNDGVDYYISVFNENGKVDERSIPWNGSYKNTFTQPGKYSAYMTATNKFGSVDSKWIGFEIVDRQATYAKLSTSKAWYTTKDKAELIPESDYGCDYYYAIWDPNGNKIERHTIRGENLILDNLIPGRYSGYMSAGNTFGGPDSNWIEFEVIDTKPTYADLKTDKESYTVGETAVLIPETKYATDVYCSVYDPNGQKIINGEHYDIGQNIEVSNLIEGTYLAWISAGNVFGGIDSKRIEFTVTEAVIKGDLNGNGKVDLMDARKAKQAAMRQIELSETELKAADLNGDGRVDVMEARKIKQAAMKQVEL